MIIIFPLEVTIVETEVSDSIDSLGATTRIFVCLIKISTWSFMSFLVLLNSLQYRDAEALRIEDFEIVLLLDGFILVKMHHLLFGLMLY